MAECSFSGENRQDLMCSYSSLDAFSQEIIDSVEDEVPPMIRANADVEILNNNNIEVIDLSQDIPPPDVLPGVQPIPPKQRIRAQKFALTYPRCYQKKEEAMRLILEKFGEDNIKFCVVSEEDHKDGTPHLHVSLWLKERISYNGKKNVFWDFIGGQHGNYQMMRSAANWTKYVSKGGNYISFPSNFNVDAFLLASKNKKSKESVTIANKILDGTTDIKQLHSDHAGFLLMNLGKVRAFISHAEEAHFQSIEPETLVPLPADDDFLPFESEIYEWLRAAQSVTKEDRSLIHLRIEGRTDIGKSSLLLSLERFFRQYHVPLEEDFYCEWDDNAYDLVVFDEFQCQKTITWMNRFTDGMNCPLKRKGAQTARHRRKTPCVILSNYTWDDSYHKLAQFKPAILDTVKRRFKTILIPEEENLFKIINYINQINQ